MQSQIRLVAWSDADLELLRRANTPEMWKHLGGPESEEKVLRRHQRYLPANWTGGGGMFRIELEPTHEPVGLVGYWDRDEDGEPVYETGWHVLPEYQSRGIATAAVRALLERAATQPGPRRIHAYPSSRTRPRMRCAAGSASPCWVQPTSSSRRATRCGATTGRSISEPLTPTRTARAPAARSRRAWASATADGVPARCSLPS